MSEIDKIIANAANNAAEGVTRRKVFEDKSQDTYSEKPLNTQYYSHKYLGMSEGAKKILAKVYLIRSKSFKDDEWVDLYKDWLIETDRKFHDKDTGLKDMVTMSVYYWEKYNSRRQMFKKNIEGFSSLKEYALHEIRKELDINYDN